MNEEAGDNRVGRGLLAETPGAVLAIVGLGLTILTKESSILASFQSLEAEDAGVSTFLISSSFFAILCVLFLRFPRLRLHRHPVMGFGIGIATSVAMVVFYGQGIVESAAWLLTVCHVVQRLGGYLLILMWAEVLYPLGSHRVGAIFAFAVFVSAGLSALTALLKSGAAVAVLSTCPIVAVICIYYFREYDASHSGRELQKSQVPLLPGERDGSICLLGNADLSRRDAVALIAVLCAIIFCSRFSLAGVHYLWVSLQDAATISLSGQLANALGSVFAGILLLIVVRWFWGRSTSVFISVILLAMIFISMNLSNVIDRSQVLFYLAPMSAGEKIVYLFILIGPFIVFSKHPGVCVCLSLCATELGLLAYTVCAKAMTPSALGIIVTVMVGLLTVCIICLLFFANRPVGSRKGEASRGGISQGGTSQGGTSREHVVVFNTAELYGMPELPENVRDSCFDLADRFQLTRRETEILLLLANRYNAQSIAEILVITVATTKTHMRNVYAKLGVHSQRELLEVIDGKREPGE